VSSPTDVAITVPPLIVNEGNNVRATVSPITVN
jgi:hypothetical protein